jgi:ferredoxin, 2Fe-2S
MPKITYVLADSTAQPLDVPIGTSVRDAALDEGLVGIEGECGGFLNCATCHVYVDDTWAGRLPGADDLEDELLEGTAAERRPGSRLSCQLVVAEDWDGLIVHMPENQY